MKTYEYHLLSEEITPDGEPKTRLLDFLKACDIVDALSQVEAIRDSLSDRTHFQWTISYIQGMPEEIVD